MQFPVMVWQQYCNASEFRVATHVGCGFLHHNEVKHDAGGMAISTVTADSQACSLPISNWPFHALPTIF